MIKFTILSLLIIMNLCIEVTIRARDEHNKIDNYTFNLETKQRPLVTYQYKTYHILSYYKSEKHKPTLSFVVRITQRSSSYL
jgi:hypothetical protein